VRANDASGKLASSTEAKHHGNSQLNTLKPIELNSVPSIPANRINNLNNYDPGLFSFPSSSAVIGDFTVSATPSARTVTRGGTATYTITIQSSGGFNSAVNLFAINLPGNQVLPGTGFNPSSVTPPANNTASSTLSIVTNSTTPTGTFTITIEGRSGGVTRSTTINLTVNAPPTPDFTISTTPSGRTVTQGGTAAYTITVQSQNGFNNSVSLFALNLPGNQVLPGTGFSPSSVTPPSNSSSGSTLNIVTNSSTPTGTFTITVEGRSGGVTRSTSVNITVNPAPTPDFTISATPSARTVTQGGTAAYTITVQSLNSFSNSVSLFAINLPGNQTLPGTGFNPQSLTPSVNGAATSTLNIVTNTSTPTGTFTITVEGRSGGVTRSTTVSLTVNPAPPPDFTVSAAPTARTVTQGGTATYTVTVQSINGFNSAVSLAAINLPNNQVLPGTGFNPATVTPSTNGSSTSTLSIVTNNATPTGTFTVTVEGRSGGVTRSATISLTVNPAPPPDFTISATPTARTVAQGGTATYTITVQSANNFGGSVGLFAINLPNNQVLPGTGFNPSILTLPANGSVNSTLNIVTNTATPLGTFTITIEARSGGVTRSVPITLTVNPAPPLDFTVTVASPARTLTQGGTASYTVTVQSVNNSSGPVSLHAINLPDNQVLPGTGFNPSTVTPPANGSVNSTLKIVTNSATPTGTFTIAIEGRSGGVTRSSNITLTVNPGGPAPTITRITPSSVIVNELTTLTVTGNNFHSNFKAQVITSLGTFDIVQAGLNPVSSTQVKVQVVMGGTSPYNATLKIINSDQQSATHPFQVAAATQPPSISPLRVKGIEVTQGIQNLRHQVPLIQDKRTFVRVYVESALGNIGPVQAQLMGTRINNPGPNETRTFLGSLTPSNLGQSIIVRQSPPPRRANLNDGFYFELPNVPQNWRQGTVELEFQDVSHPFSCLSPNSNNCKKVRVTFEPPLVAEMRLIGITWRENGEKHEPSSADFERVAHEIEATFPISRLNRESRPSIEFDERPTSSEHFVTLVGRLKRKRILDGCISSFPVNCKRYYFGVLIDPPSFGTFGFAPGAEDQDAPCDARLRGDVAAAYLTDRYTPSHEFGHLTGRYHTDYIRQRATNCEAENCEPYPPDCQHNPADGTLSQTKSEWLDSTFYGLDIFTMRVYDSSTADLMSYGQTRWVSPHTYVHIRERLLARYSNASISGREANEKNTVMVVTAGEPAVLISGTVTLGQNAGQIESVYALNSPAPVPAPSPGSYTIRFQNNQGQELSSYSFEPEQPSEGSTGVFTLLLPWNSNTARIVLLHNGQEIASRNASTRAPTVNILYPNGGEALVGSSVTLRWASSDPDGNSITYVIQYSADAGATWQTLVSDWPSTTYELDLSAIAGTNQGLIRVLASDGFHTAQDQSDATFAVARNLPQVSIQSPQDNALYVSDQTIILEGGAYDPDDGQLGDAALTWSSNLDGSLGSGRTLSINALVLVEGTHTLTLTARDSDGQTSDANITIQVSRTRPTLPASLSLSPAAINFSSGTGSVQTAPEVIAIRNNGDGTLNWAATADQGWIRLSHSAGTAPENISVSADPTSLPVGQYTGQVRITTADASNSPQIVPLILNITAAKTLQFSNSNFQTAESSGSATLIVTRTGDASSSATVDYATIDNPAAVRCDARDAIAYARCDYSTTVDTLRFAPGETQKTISIPLIDDAHVEDPETVQVVLSNPTGDTIFGAPSTTTLTITDNDTTASANPIFNSPFFVRMQYLDFLSREPEADGLAAWLRVLNGCSDVNNNPECDRNHVSSSFFRSQEFQLKGYFVYLFYKVSLNRRPDYAEIIPDMRAVTGQTTEELNQKRAAFADAFVQRPEFRAAYDGKSNTEYVDLLLNPYNAQQITTADPNNPDANGQVTLTRADLVNRLQGIGGQLTRAQVLRAVVQSREASAAEFNGAFVAMQYYGYLRRAPEEDGYQAWLRALNNNPADFRVMVDGFMNSVEYRLRFGRP